MATLEKLYAPQSAQGKPAVIFVHGLGGHPRETWMFDSKETSLWPVWVGQDTGCPVWTLAYDAALSGWVDGAMPLPDQGTTVLDLLNAEKELAGAPLVLIGHSLGGLVIKTAIEHAATLGVPRYEEVLSRVRAVVFIATPHLGSDLANLALALTFLLRTNDQVRDLTQHDAQLRALNTKFRVLQQRLQFQVRTFAEMRGVFVGRKFLGVPFGRHIQVVATGNADPHVAGETAVSLPEDHFSICKPRDRNAQIHKAVVTFLSDLVTQRESAQAGYDVPPEPVGNATRQLPVMEPVPSTSDQSGRLRGPDDKRLRPREGNVYGRDEEIADLTALLENTGDDAITCVQVTGAGGVGKTEVCKAALRQWMARYPAKSAYYVEIPDGSTAAEIPYRIGVALGAENLSTFQELQSLLRSGLYYLDNIESAAESAEGQSLIRSLKEWPGVLVLASSRVSLPLVFNHDLAVGALNRGDAETLFRVLWNGSDPLVDRVDGNVVERFVEGELGCHALTISLVARLGDAYPFKRIVERWQELGSALASDPSAATRMSSLRVSMRLTSETLGKDEGALDLWALAALSPAGLGDSAVSFFVERAGWSERLRQQLTRHHIWSRDGDRYRMLPPLARYALDCARSESDGFSWLRARTLAFSYFGKLATSADSIASSEAALEARASLLAEFTALARFISLEASHSTPDAAQLGRLDAHLRNAYQFRAVLSVEMLRVLLPLLPTPAGAIKSLGDLERRMGRPDEA
ncbi:MAG: alpha/beta fold hydrolase, partial [Acidobacteriota bacterium]